MAWDYLTLGPTPGEENCAGVGCTNYAFKARKECTAYLEQLIRQFGQAPEGTNFRIKNHPHDFGTYMEVAIEYNTDVAGALEFALKVENNLPGEWDGEAKKKLTEAGLLLI